MKTMKVPYVEEVKKDWGQLPRGKQSMLYKQRNKASISGGISLYISIHLLMGFFKSRGQENMKCFLFRFICRST